MALTLTDLQKMIEQQDGLYPFDMYRANTPRQGIGSVNIPNVNLQGAPNVSPGTVLDTSKMSGTANLPTARLSTGTMSTTGSDRLDDLITGVNRGDLRSSLLANLNKEDINLGNIDDISRTLTDELFPTQTKGEKSNVLRIIKGIIGAGQSPEFQRGMELAEAEKIAGAKDTAEARADTQKTIYGKLLDKYLKDDSFTPKLQPVFTINRTTGKETGGVLRKIRDGSGFEKDEVYALALDAEGIPIKQDQMTTNQIFYQGNVYRPLDPQAESWDKDRLNLREAFNLDRGTSSQSAFDKQVQKYGDRILALNSMYGLANRGMSLLGDIVPGDTDPFGFAQAVKGVIVSGTQQIEQMRDLFVQDEMVTALAKERGISVEQQKEENAAAEEKVRQLFQKDGYLKLEGVVGSDGQPAFTWDRFGRLSDDKAKDAEYKSILLQMAYQAAMINGQEGRSLSDKDIVNMLNIVGGEVSDVNGAMRLIASFVLQTTADTETRGRLARLNFSQDIDEKPFSIEAVNQGFMDPFESLKEFSPNKTKAVLSIINRTHPDLLEGQLIDSKFDYKDFINPNTPDDTVTTTPTVTQDDINKMFTDKVLGFNLNTDD